MLLNRLPVIIVLLLCVVISGGLYIQLAPFLVKDHSASPIIQKARTSPSDQQKNKSKKSHNIAAFQLFGDLRQVIEEAKPVSKDLPKTKLKLVLTGVMASGAPTHASALIQGPDKQTENYQVGDEIPGGASLKHVYPDRVVLERSGRLENLVFVEQRSIGIETYEPPEEVEEEAEQVSSTSLPAITSRSSNPGRTQGIKDRLSKLRKRMLKNRTSQ